MEPVVLGGADDVVGEHGLSVGLLERVADDGAASRFTM